MRRASPASPPDGGDTPMTGSYLRVILVEVMVLLALWFFQQHFSH